ncbi:hypothetical protein [Hymenobacter canadensis]|uniref:Outer membrane protein beta-barrel domain-containing protein n=1 Tax=Hymenobacter canadensis TaxID=2999067 RepID=A0ABY7LRG6_9BACT|nr:hypothetical protein [Hymenobacter canadensis]WBA41800.1 hypothetical protein O3303_18560 [Hymenobacter canadensis]
MKPLLLLAGIWCLTGCAVYMPMQNAAPDIRAQHESEVRASTFLSRGEASGAYSPLKHVLVRGAFGIRTDSGDSTFWRGRQYELAAGTYWAPRNWTLGVLGGVGQIRNQTRYRNDGQIIFLGEPVQHEFDVRCNKLFGEAYALYEVSNRFSLGVSCRSTRLYFTQLTDVGQPIDLRQLTRAEPMLLMRFGLGDPYQGRRPVQLQLSVGGSATMGYDERQPDPNYSRRQLRDSRSYVALGVGILPHRLAALFRQP